MNCEDVIERIENVTMYALSDIERQSCVDHISSCDDCQNALRGAEALRTVRSQADDMPPADLFDRVVRTITRTPEQPVTKSGFWLGAGFGGAIAAAVIIAALTLGFLDGPKTEVPKIAAFMVSMNETREMNVAIDLKQALPGATVSILLSGGVELVDFGDQRELTWTDDLEIGVNKLTLPLVAIDDSGGQLIVQVDHESKRLTLRVDLKVDS